MSENQRWFRAIDTSLTAILIMSGAQLVVLIFILIALS